MGETIYNLIQPPPPVQTHNNLHVSNFAKRSVQFNTVKRYAHRTFGEPLDKIRKDPKDPLKAHERTPDLPPRPRTTSHGNETLNKPPVPIREEIPPIVDAPERNFIRENIKEAPETTVLKPEKKKTWYTEKSEYGQTPRYLDNVKREFMAETAYWDGVRESLLPEDNETRCRLLTEEERLKILEGLKMNLTENKKKYGSLSFGQDHMSFRKRKEGMENEAKQLEEDIKLFSRQNVYITEN
uniref:Loc402794 protein n=1 Tax=Coptotermes formosanus TaxID=36987 RepID=R4UK30_COPFO|nr:loc402794 protein [Coptotermes formosanus]